ncbi:RadC family protein [Sediminibacterium soli]|uniref:RadC family protein n=1 Tax=Sediminibacterium soli TaxID=2698829 RepID=UPI00137A3681|nr:DNA repair protein RadC [Sediminibacterium soli]NCI47267.1 JAB domain-containing protein [Sediminibacterium soli]
MRKYSIKDWAPDDQPRSKLVSRGAHTLSNSELLAILINNGTPQHSALDVAKNLLQAVGNDLQKLSTLTVPEMVGSRIAGLGEAKAITIAAALELGVRRAATQSKKQQILRSTEMADYLRASLQYRQQEIFAVVFLNTANKVIQIEHISEGGYTGTVADPRVILKKALQHNATALILCHNHPSGNLRPSRADELLTQKIKSAAAYFDIRIIDHIIVSHEGHFSFADEGLM